MSDHNEKTCSNTPPPVDLALEADGSLSYKNSTTSDTKSSGLQGFINSLRAAHRYVHNRRSAINQ